VSLLQIWRPASTSIKNKLPIQVYIHVCISLLLAFASFLSFYQGGGLLEGSGSEWDGTGLVRRSITTHKPIIFITFNYRLGVLGFVSTQLQLLRR
jgi:carboxylesterase type B